MSLSATMQNSTIQRFFLAIAFVALAYGAFLVWSSGHEAPAVHRLAQESARQPSESGWIKRTYPFFEADPQAYRAALAQKGTLARKKGSQGSWEFAGPANIGGRVTDLAIHPSEPQTLYAAAATGGVFRSRDLGQTWNPIFDEQPFLSIGDIAIAPSNPGVIYVGTGEANGGHNNYAGGGLYRSEDGGESWSFRGLGETVSIGRVVVHPDDPNRLWVAGVGSYFAPNPERGVFRSTDGGLSWSKTLFVNDSTGVVDIAMRPGNPDVLFATTWQRVRRVTGSFLYGRGSAVYRSEDAGNTWELLGPNRGLPNPDDFVDSSGRVRIGRIGVAISESFPATVYAYYTSGSGYRGLYRSTDGGDSWEDANPSGSITRASSRAFTFSWYFGQIRVDPVDPARVFVLDVAVLKSEDGGETWSSRNGTHVDHHAMLFHPQNPGAIFDGNDGGVALSLNGGVSWEKLAPLPITQFYEIAVDPGRPQRLFGGTQDNGTIWTSTGATNDWKSLFGGDGFYVLPIPGDATRAYAESQWGNLVRVDGLFGSPFPFPIATGTGIPALEDERRNFAVPLAMDPFDPQILYYGTYRIWRTEDGVATNWQPISGDLTRGTEIAKLGTLTTIAVSPLDGNVIWAGSDDGKIHVSSDYGVSWTDVSAGMPLRWVTRVLPAPDNVATAYVTFSGLKWRDPVPHVFRTRNLGRTWTDITSDLPDAPVNAIAIDPKHTDRVFVGTDIGMFASLDDGISWSPMDDGIPAVTTTDLKIDAFGRRLIAGTHGRGMYTFALDQLSGGTVATDPSAELPAVIRMDAPFPNPFRDRTRVTVTGAVESASVFDLAGRLVGSASVFQVGPDRAVVEWDGQTTSGAPAPSGAYLIVARQGSRQEVASVVRVR
jgi:photosystem II stability/assembly factor-like uncharacterized protein